MAPAPPVRRLTKDTTEWKNKKDSLAGEAKALAAVSVLECSFVTANVSSMTSVADFNDWAMTDLTLT